MNDPRLPDKVLFGLMFVNFGPLKILPKRIPPISEDMHTSKIMNNIILKCISLTPNVKIIKIKNRYNANRQFNKNFLIYFFLINKLDNFVNSTKDSAKTDIDIKRYIILLKNIKINNSNKKSPVLTLL